MSTVQYRQYCLFMSQKTTQTEEDIFCTPQGIESSFNPDFLSITLVSVCVGHRGVSIFYKVFLCAGISALYWIELLRCTSGRENRD